MPAFGSFPPDHPVLLTPAVWCPGAPRQGPAVLLFRRAFTLDEALDPSALWISASQRFVLFLDGRPVLRGPPRSDPERWNVARWEFPALAAGVHTLAVCVWHAGPFTAKAQLGGPGFLLIAAEPGPLKERLATGSPGWRTRVDSSRRPLTETAGQRRGHLDVGAGEDFDAAQHPAGWAQAGFDEGDWLVPEVVCEACANPWGNQPLGHTLRPAPIPAMREASAGWSRAMGSEGEGPPADWIAGGSGWRVPPGSSARIVLDRGCLTNAYPRLVWSGGGGAFLRLVSSEAPVDPVTRTKGNRDRIDGMELPGQLDIVRPSGGDREEVWEPLWFRSFRYLLLEIQTAGEALALRVPGIEETGFPLESVFRGDPGPGWSALNDVSLRTARLCSHETFFDCPHYEQAQFPGDGRILARYHYLIANDDRLPRKAIDDLHAGRTPSGLLRSHYPCSMYQIISTYSLQWIGMLHDFRVYRGDADFLKPYLPVARGILDWFLGHRRADGLVGRVEAPFTDWTPGFDAGTAPQEADGGSSLVSALAAEACGWMAGLERFAGIGSWAGRWDQEQQALRTAVRATCIDPVTGYIADTPNRRSFSLHAQIQSVLAGVVAPSEASDLLERAMCDPALIPLGTLYFRAYLFEALRKAGLRARFPALLGPWKAHLANGLSTWPESDGNPRSDCHAWSVAPSVEFIESILGLSPDPDASGFAAAWVNPVPAEIPVGSFEVATPAGVFRVRRPAGPEQVEVRVPVPIRHGDQSLPAGTHRFPAGRS